MKALNDRLLLHLARGIRETVEPADVYFLEAVEGGTKVRLRGSRPLLDIRVLGELAPLFEPHGFLRVHRNHMVNLRRVRLIRRRPEGREWELKLDPPVNKVLPVSRDETKRLWAAFGE